MARALEPAAMSTVIAAIARIAASTAA